MSVGTTECADTRRMRTTGRTCASQWERGLMSSADCSGEAESAVQVSGGASAWAALPERARVGIFGECYATKNVLCSSGRIQKYQKFRITFCLKIWAVLSHYNL